MKRASTKIALTVLLAAIAGVLLLLSLMPDSRRPGALALAQVTELAPPVPVDTPPPLRAASGWPFAQLPHIAKFEAPVPRMSVTMVPRTPYAPPIPVRSWPPPESPNGVSPLWLASPLAAGAYLVSADVTGHDSVVPEPATLLLLASGLLLLGLRVLLRRILVTARN